MPILHIYLPGEERGVIIPADEAYNALQVTDYFQAAGSEFSVFEQPDTRTDITPAYWDPEDSTFALETKRNTAEAARVHINLKEETESYLYYSSLGMVGTIGTIHIPAHTDAFAIVRFHRLRRRIRTDLYDVGGFILHLKAHELDEFAEAMPRSDRHRA